MKLNKLINLSVIIGFSNLIYGNTIEDDIEFIDDFSDIYSRECRAITTFNLNVINSCLKFLNDPNISENELNFLCNSFEDVYAKDSETEDEEDEEKEVEDEEEEDEISILQMSKLTEEEREAVEQLNKVFSDIINNDIKNPLIESEFNQDMKHHHSRERRRNYCKVYVKKWQRECHDIKHFGPTINAALENYYFMRSSYCLKNNDNRYCTIVLNDIKSKAYNGTDHIVNQLNKKQQSSTCECYKLKMDYLKEEYFSSKDPEVEKTKKNYNLISEDKDNIRMSKNNKRDNQKNEYIPSFSRIEKRLVNELNIKELKKQIIKYQQEMSLLSEASSCNITYVYNSKGATSKAHPKLFIHSKLLFTLFLCEFLFYILL